MSALLELQGVDKILKGEKVDEYTPVDLKLITK